MGSESEAKSRTLPSGRSGVSAKVCRKLWNRSLQAIEVIACVQLLPLHDGCIVTNGVCQAELQFL